MRGTGDLLRAKLKRRGRGLDMVTTHDKHNSLVNRLGHCVVSQILPHQPVDVVQNVKQIIFFWAEIRTKYNSTSTSLKPTSTLKNLSLPQNLKFKYIITRL